MQEDIRAKRLQQIAEQDEIYLVWKNSFEDFTPQFGKFVKWCPKKIRNFLYGYADCGRMMMQRIVNLACEHMEFPDEKK